MIRMRSSSNDLNELRIKISHNLYSILLKKLFLHRDFFLMIIIIEFNNLKANFQW